MADRSQRVIPQADVPFLNGDGTVNRQWYFFFERVNQDMGGDGRLSIPNTAID